MTKREREEEEKIYGTGRVDASTKNSLSGQGVRSLSLSEKTQLNIKMWLKWMLSCTTEIVNFREGKGPSEDLFDELDTDKLNACLKQSMDGLTARVFRTCTASTTLEEMLIGESMNGADATSKKIEVYHEANKNVAELCNHRRTLKDGKTTRLLLITSQSNYLDPRILVYFTETERWQNDKTEHCNHRRTLKDGKTLLKIEVYHEANKNVAEILGSR
ncbi:hypothetical protein Vadar_020138 [Vaccinium darrowii]|uniref:Uncharacterized protein n=1 Tax=Vaccinium darrowii TaxID=229202 RepID=A0ACB7ZLF5_9ERIC|nr:hypothetical protein Vadar_020138 [Vaccinium darrowii]